MSSAVARGDAESADNREVFEKINLAQMIYVAAGAINCGIRGMLGEGSPRPLRFAGAGLFRWCGAFSRRRGGLLMWFTQLHGSLRVFWRCFGGRCRAGWRLPPAPYAGLPLSGAFARGALAALGHLRSPLLLPLSNV
ncbi:hypothetical protein C8J57DRAFT_1248325 [Mycena rebaudengoi]|nr:hypothetical protein C8J57DRAFT_1248325 [Mycena rebaudengoi]